MSWWPFGKRQKMVPLPSVELTDDERQECESYIRSATQSEGGTFVIREDLADSFKRSLIATCLLGRAERFSSMADRQPDFEEKVCSAGAKACAIFPLSVNFFDFACVLERLNRQDEAKAMFREFLRRQADDRSPDPVEQIALSHRDIASAVQYARARV